MRRASLDQVLSMPVHTELIAIEARLGGGSAAAVLAGVATRKVVGKVVAKGVLGLAAKSLAKVAVSKASTIAAGALIGGIAGSAVPGFGTAIGAAAGGALAGLVAGLTVDKLLLMLEEQLSRKEFRQQILAGIHDARDEFKQSLKEPGTAGDPAGTAASR